MAEYKSEHFIPDKVDEQIDSSLAGQHTTQHPDPFDVQVIQALQRHYIPASDHRELLERVWNRLAQHRASIQSSPSESATQTGLQSDNAVQLTRRNRMLVFRDLRPQNTSPRRLNMIAAIVFAILLVGSMFAIFHQVRQGQEPVEGRPTVTKQPVVSTDDLYVIVNNTIYHYNATTHKQVWSFPMPLPSGAGPIPSHGQVVGNVLYIPGSGSDGYYSYAINTSDGSLRWRFKVDYQSSNLNLVGNQLVANGTVYLSEASGVGGYSIVTALDASTGAIRWQRRYNGTGIATRDQPLDAATGLTLEAATSEVLYGTTYTGKIDAPVTTLFAISAKSGSVLWQKKVSTDDEQPDYSGGLVVNGVLCIAASAVDQPGTRHLYGYDAITGEQKWRVPLDGEASGFTSLNGIIYLSTVHFQTAPDNSVYASSGSVYAVQAADGAQLWRHRAQAGISSPVVQDGVVLVTVSQEDAKREATIVALDAGSGNVRWTRPAASPTSNEFPASPQLAASKNSIYVNYFDGQIQVLRISDGKLINTFTVPAPDPASSSGVDIIAVVPAGDSSS